MKNTKILSNEDTNLGTGSRSKKIFPIKVFKQKIIEIHSKMTEIYGHRVHMQIPLM